MSDIKVDINNSFGNSGIVPQENTINKVNNISPNKNMGGDQMKKVVEEDNFNPIDTNDMNEPFIDSKTPKQFNPDEDLLDNEDLNDLINPRIYIRGVKSDSFYLILSGKVMICSGNEGFFLE